MCIFIYIHTHTIFVCICLCLHMCVHFFLGGGMYTSAWYVHPPTHNVHFYILVGLSNALELGCMDEMSGDIGSLCIDL